MLWTRLGNKNLYLSLLIIVLGNLLLTMPLQNFLMNVLKIGQGWFLDFLAMFIITFVLLVTTLEVFEL